MKAIILAAGYATRMYPITLERPKALLPIKDKPMIDYVLRKIEEINEVDKVFIVTNNKFYGLFLEWKIKNNIKYSKNIEIINDLTNSNEERFGGVGDLWYTIENGKINDDVLVLNSDNLFDFSLLNSVKLFYDKKKIVNGVYMSNKETAKKHGVVSVTNNKIIEFEEKPKNPKSDIISIGIYFFPKKYLKKIKEYMDLGNNNEGLGYLIKYFCEKGEEVYSYLFNGKLLDIGDINTYNKINEVWQE